ncbi:hypothetical protein BVRB_4g077510 [Beta vulgaris subsp. vulgaris]|nr:hypothetical protein BVRB_4g077510 [Beta vulgaris subsp. vulgaris]
MLAGAPRWLYNHCYLCQNMRMQMPGSPLSPICLGAAWQQQILHSLWSHFRQHLPAKCQQLIEKNRGKEEKCR